MEFLTNLLEDLGDGGRYSGLDLFEPEVETASGEEYPPRSAPSPVQMVLPLSTKGRFLDTLPTRNGPASG